MFQSELSQADIKIFTISTSLQNICSFGPGLLVIFHTLSVLVGRFAGKSMKVLLQYPMLYCAVEENLILIFPATFPWKELNHTSKTLSLPNFSFVLNSRGAFSRSKSILESFQSPAIIQCLASGCNRAIGYGICIK